MKTSSIVAVLFAVALASAEAQWLNNRDPGFRARETDSRICLHRRRG
jgi:hypothetical protein